MKGKVSNLLRKVKNFFIKIYKSFIKGIKLLFNKIVMFIKTTYNKIKSFIKKDNKTKYEKIILYLSYAVILLLIIFIILLCIFKVINKNNNDSYHIIKESFNKLLNYDDYKLNQTIDVYDYNDNFELINGSCSNVSMVKKNNNINIELTSKEDNDSYSLAHIFFNDDRIEFIFGDESYYVRYKNIFSVVSNYLPSLTELSNDLSKLSYKDYYNLINKDIKKYYKKAKKKNDESLLKSFINDSYTDDEETSTYINGTLYSLKRYYIKKNARDFIKLKIDMLTNSMIDRDVNRLLYDINQGLLDIADDNKDYEKIRMDKDEYNMFRYSYGNVIPPLYNEYISKLIKNNEVLYGLLSKDDEIEIALYLTKNNEVKQVYIFVPTLVNNKVKYIKSTIILDNINDVKSKEVIPSNKTRINSNDVTRSNLYIIVDKIKNKLDIIKDKYEIDLFKKDE